MYRMPTVHRIDNIRIVIRGNDHPPPHIHVIANSDEEARIYIADLTYDYSTLKPKDLQAALDWARDNQASLALKWVEIVES